MQDINKKIKNKRIGNFTTAYAQALFTNNVNNQKVCQGS